jgi:hypothetical protein
MGRGSSNAPTDKISLHGLAIVTGRRSCTPPAVCEMLEIEGISM